MAAISVKVYRYSPEQVTDATVKNSSGVSTPTATSVATRLAADLAADSITSANIRHIACAPNSGEMVYTILHW